MTLPAALALLLLAILLGAYLRPRLDRATDAAVDLLPEVKEEPHLRFCGGCAAAYMRGDLGEGVRGLVGRGLRCGECLKGGGP
jgi:hypothetical protein